MRENQRGRRNLSPAWKVELELGNKADLLHIANDSRKEKMTGNQNASKEKTELSENDKTVLPPVNTRVEIAKAARVSTGQVGMAELELGNKEDLLQIGKKSQGRRTDLLSENDKKLPAPSPVTLQMKKQLCH